MAQTNRYKDLELRQLRSFCQAAQHGNFTAAARQLGLSTTTVWQQVRALEQRLGTRLLRAHGRNLEVTPDGRLLLDIVQPHVGGLDSLERLFHSRRAELPQHMTVASTYYLLSCHLPAALREFTGRHPSIRLNLRASLWPEVIRQVENGEADVGVVSYAQDAPRSSDLVFEPLLNLNFTLLIACDNPLAQQKRVRLRDLVAYPFITPARQTFSFQTLERVLRRDGLFERIHVIMESPNNDLMRRYVALGFGIGLTYLADETVDPFPGLVQRILDPHLDVLPVYLVTRRGAHLPQPVEEFREIVHRCLGSGKKGS